MADSRPVSLIVVGSIAIDTIETPSERREEILGGSATYGCAAASFFARPGLVGIVGDDFPPGHLANFRRLGVDLAGLQVVPGKTFRWTGVYEENMDNRRTLCTELNVFASFRPDLPEVYRDCEYVLLGNIAPVLQLHVLDQARQPRFVLADTMDLWINTARDELLRVIGRVDLITMNESEARRLTGERVLLRAARALLGLGPRYVVIKKGEHGSILFSRDGVFLMPAFPLEEVKDPTGAGDCFAGGLVGALARTGEVSEPAIRSAMVYGSVAAAFGVEAFSLDRLLSISAEEIEERAALFRLMLKVE
jgi:sugar/nucleoside kinase (ribokinase family)